MRLGKQSGSVLVGCITTSGSEQVVDKVRVGEAGRHSTSELVAGHENDPLVSVPEDERPTDLDAVLATEGCRQGDPASGTNREQGDGGHTPSVGVVVHGKVQGYVGRATCPAAATRW